MSERLGGAIHASVAGVDVPTPGPSPVQTLPGQDGRFRSARQSRLPIPPETAVLTVDCLWMGEGRWSGLDFAGPGGSCTLIRAAPIAQSAERLHGKEKVKGSIPFRGSVVCQRSRTGWRTSCGGVAQLVRAHDS